MKITKLVLIFNLNKILVGLIVSTLLLFGSFLVNSSTLNLVMKAASALVLLNIIASIIASHVLYDKSDLYKLQKINDYLGLTNIKKAVLIHASFDPISKSLEKRFPNMELTVCDIFENRHEKDKGIKISKKMFPPNPKEIKITPAELPFTNNSQDLILAITAIHEILNHHDRVKFFREAKRILNANGHIVLSEQLRNPINFLFFNIGAFHFISQKQWEKAIKSAGLRIDENIKVTPFANVFLIKK